LEELNFNKRTEIIELDNLDKGQVIIFIFIKINKKKRIIKN
jgi:hypothetical protein